ncbi:MAG: hypothetical protein HY785_08635 [Oscillatoriophycideae cyanobacterium NC_groundwater_1537_Pr4_S-0.65um_50_18]|nr:hypothetical protein [Oscillatoriophycideae cyanobacterium NC_groundwater_1537_Pr4_S-0.65um_50_18]
MARYTGLFTVAVPADRFWQLLVEILRACSLNVIYSSEDYLVAREVPGGVTYAKLVTVEILIEPVLDREAEVRMNLVVKNEELPLQINNHCQQVFRLLNQAVEENRHWRVVESAVS